MLSTNSLSSGDRVYDRRSDLLQHWSEYWKPRIDTVLGRLEPIGEADALNQQRIVDGLGE